MSSWPTLPAQVLKFDYMPRFLISETFTKLEDGTRRRRGSSTKVIDMSAILSEPQCLKALIAHLSEKSKPENNQTTLYNCDAMIKHVNLWQEIEAYKEKFSQHGGEATEEDIKTIRQKIWSMQQAHELRLPKGLEVAVSQQFAKSNKSTVVTCIQSQNFLADILHVTVQKSFLKSSEYEAFVNNAPPEFVLDSTILHLSNFKDDRQLKETKDEYMEAFQKALHFSNVFKDTMLAAYYRRYLRLTFCEENFFFIQELKDLQNVNTPLKRRSWMDDDNIIPIDDDNEAAILKQKVISIYHHYIVDGRKFEVNIPGKVKLSVKKDIEAGNFYLDMFKGAEIEIMRVLKHDSFDRFKKHYIFEHFKRAFFVKFSQRHFVVGDMVKGQHDFNERLSGSSWAGYSYAESRSGSFKGAPEGTEKAGAVKA